MKRRKLSVVSALILLVHVMAAAEPGIALKLEPAGTGSHIPPLLDCAPPAQAARSDNLSASFRDNVLALLGALPPAGAPTGFAAAHSGGDRAFARAFCFGSGARGDSSPYDECRNCLSAAAQDVADGCRGAVWRAGCFLSYADTGACTAREGAWRGWFDDDDSAAGDTPSAACMPDRTAAECSRCLSESAQVVPALKEGRQLSLLHGDSVVVLGYYCYLRVLLFTPIPRWERYFFKVFDVVALVIIEVVGVLFCICRAREYNPAPAA